MIYLIFKELKFFFSSLVGFSIIFIFLMINGLTLWWHESNFNVLDYGYANLDMLFVISPLLFLFFIPALCMRAFSEEYFSGTIELLVTKPISVINIVLAKYLSVMCIVFISILTTLIYTISISYLTESQVNIDIGCIVGSYIGLLCLSSLFISISIFASAIVDNQIISLILSLIFCGLFYFGFDFISKIQLFENHTLIVEKIGISFHYTLMSKGLIKLNSLIYFISISYLFIKLTENIIKYRKH